MKAKVKKVSNKRHEQDIFRGELAWPLSMRSRIAVREAPRGYVDAYGNAWCRATGKLLIQRAEYGWEKADFLPKIVISTLKLVKERHTSALQKMDFSADVFCVKTGGILTRCSIRKTATGYVDEFGTKYRRDGSAVDGESVIKAGTIKPLNFILGVPLPFQSYKENYREFLERATKSKMTTSTEEVH